MKSKLLENGEPIIYDIKDEFKTELKMLPQDSNIVKLEKYYKHQNDKCTDKFKKIDCDVSEFAVLVE